MTAHRAQVRLFAPAVELQLQPGCELRYSVDMVPTRPMQEWRAA